MGPSSPPCPGAVAEPAGAGAVSTGLITASGGRAGKVMGALGSLALRQVLLEKS